MFLKVNEALQMIKIKQAAEERRKEKEAATLAQLAAQEKRAEEVTIQSHMLVSSPDCLSKKAFIWS